MHLIRIVGLAVLVTALSASSANALDIEIDVQPIPGEVGTPYEFQFKGEEGCVPYRFSYLNGTVPPGLRITEDGKLIGTPTEAGSFTFWVGLDDSVDCKSMQSQAPFTMIVLHDLAVTTTSLTPAIPGMPYSAQLQFSNPEFGWPVIWDITQGSLPQGLSLSAEGAISGTPAGPDVKTFTVRAREPFRRFGERQLTLAVAMALQASSALRTGEVGVRYSGAIRAAGGVQPLTWSVTSGTLPRGLSLNTSTGAINGVPRAAGAFTLTLAVTDTAGQQATVQARFRIAAKLAITTARLPDATVGDRYRVRIASRGGIKPTVWRIVRGTLPRGIRLDRRAGVLAGAAREAGSFRITVEANDGLGAKATKTLRLSVVG